MKVTIKSCPSFKACLADRRGAIALSSILILSMILLVVGLAMVFSGFTQNQIAYSQDKASGAFYIAESGVLDAMQKIARNKNYVNAGYNLSAGGGSATVEVTNPAPGQAQVLSTGASGGYTKKIQVVLNIDTNGAVAVNSWQELSN